jgi:hypothetical protein
VVVVVEEEVVLGGSVVDVQPTEVSIVEPVAAVPALVSVVGADTMAVLEVVGPSAEAPACERWVA